MPNVGLPEIIIVLLIALVVFGPKRLPELGRSLGEGMRGFKESLSGSGAAAPSAPVASAPPENTVSEESSTPQ